MSISTRLRRTLTLAALAAVTLPAVTSSSASATAWDPHVRIQGSSICAGNGTTWVWVEASNGERGWATKGRGGYSFDLWNVPRGSSITLRANYGNETFRCTDTFGVSRPAVGVNATRNLYKLVPNG